jgi:hypothetical protein
LQVEGAAIPSPTPLPRPPATPTPFPATPIPVPIDPSKDATDAYYKYVNGKNESEMDVDKLIELVDGIHEVSVLSDTFDLNNEPDKKVFNRLASEAQKLCRSGASANAGRIQQIRDAVGKMGSVFVSQLNRKLTSL